MTIHHTVSFPSPFRIAAVAATLLAAVTFSGCTTTPAVMDPFSGIREAKTRAEVERQASHDPFPSAADVGLK